MKPRTVAIVQARMGSARFPGKMLANLGGHSLLEWVLHRVSRSHLLDETVLATSTSVRDDALAELAAKVGIRTCRGDELDVLGRFVMAAKKSEATHVVRVCADNPFIDPDEIDRLVTFFQSTACDYACNHMDRLGSRYADGFGAEILSAALLQDISRIATDPKHREHVTLYLWEHAARYRMRAVPSPSSIAYPELRFDVDTPSDLAALEKLISVDVDLHTPAPQIVALQRARSSQSLC